MLDVQSLPFDFKRAVADSNGVRLFNARLLCAIGRFPEGRFFEEVEVFRTYAKVYGLNARYLGIIPIA